MVTTGVMIKLPLRLRLVAACLSFTAGFVDALGFIQLGGYFISFMSGNSTRLAVGLSLKPADALMPAGLILLFLAGVVGGSLLGLLSSRWTRGRLLMGIGLLLALAAMLATTGLSGLAVLLTPIAMGAMNTVFQREGEVSVGVTYMTGTLVKFGQRLAATLAGGARWDWIPYLLLWLGLVLGAICGALIYPYIGLNALWLPAAALVIIGWMHGPEGQT